MSGLVKAVKKVFRKVVKFVKRHWKVIVIAAAVYFTAGIALGSFAPTAGFSAAMPGFGAGGMFSNAAVAMGFTGATGSGIAATVAANAAAVAGTAATVTSVAGGLVNLPATGAVASQAAGLIAPVATVSKVASTLSAMEKIAVVQTLFKTAGGLLSDSPDDINRKQHERSYGNAGGIGRDGTGPGHGGAVKTAYADQFGGTRTQADEPFGGAAEETEQVASATGMQGSYGGDANSPFGTGEQITAKSESEATRDQQAISSGYRGRNYMPI